MFPRLVVHIPHASTVIPEDVRQDFVLTDEDLAGELLWMTDHYTDELYGVEHPAIALVEHPVSRLVLDPERFPDDAQEPMNRVGMSAVYSKGSLGQALRRSDCHVSREELFERYFHPHHRRLSRAVNDALQEGEVLIVDGHSYPLTARPFEPDPDGERAQICIGTDAFHTPPALVKRLRQQFEGLGYSVSVDTPFKGSIVPMEHYGKTREVKSVMIELRRDIYMNLQDGSKSGGFERVRGHVHSVLEGLLGSP